MKDLLRTADLSPGDFRRLMELTAEFKREPMRKRTLLANETVVLYFNKPSTRTRISFETAVARLGGTPVSVGPNDLQLGRGETVGDTAATISRFARAFITRTYRDEDLRTFAEVATIPVINALTDGHHPCQSLADLFTMQEEFGALPGRKLAYVGDGNNVVHSLLEASALAGSDLAVATPEGFEPDPAVVAGARALAARSGSTLVLTHDPLEAVRGADAVYTDVWLSMGDAEEERTRRYEALRPYQVSVDLFAQARPDAIFLHCLPQHRGEEVVTEVTDGPRSRTFEQAENRLHTAIAVLDALLEGLLEGADKEE
jgi:ornithine carbamoyltransferase